MEEEEEDEEGADNDNENGNNEEDAAKTGKDAREVKLSPLPQRKEKKGAPDGAEKDGAAEEESDDENASPTSRALKAEITDLASLMERRRAKKQEASSSSPSEETGKAEDAESSGAGSAEGKSSEKGESGKGGGEAKSEEKAPASPMQEFDALQEMMNARKAALKERKKQTTGSKSSASASSKSPSASSGSGTPPVEKDISAELEEAINTPFALYRRHFVPLCYGVSDIFLRPRKIPL